MSSGAPRLSRQSVHDFLGVLAAVLVGISPLPLGGNVPLAWYALMVVVGVLSISYSALLALSSSRFPFGFGRYWLVAALWTVVCLFGFAQSLRLPYLSVEFVTGKGDVIRGDAMSIAPGQALIGSLQWVAYGTFFFIVMQVSGRERRTARLLAAVFWIAVGWGGYGLIQLTQWNDTLFGMTKWAYLGSATGPFVNRNSFATFLAIGLVCGAALALKKVERRPRDRGTNVLVILQSVLGLAIVASALFATQSRMGLLAGCLGAAAVSGLWIWRARAQAWPAVFLLAAMLAAGVALFGSGVLERLGSAEQALDVRISFYRQILTMIESRPLSGFGLGTFELAYQLFHEPPVSVDVVWDKAHSTYLGLWSELGLLIGTAPLLAIGLILFRLIRAYALRHEVSPANLAAIGTVVVGATHAMVDFSLEIQAVTLQFAMVLAIGFGEALALRSSDKNR
jgi:O-antigen ligase